MEWGALAIPVVAALILWKHPRFQRRVTWWEILIPLGVSILCIVISQQLGVTSQTHDTEYWGGYGLRAEYYEAWKERVSCRHERYHYTKDRKGNRKKVHDGWEHSYDVDSHPPRWQIVGSNGEEIAIGSNEFEALARRWHNRVFQDLHHPSEHTPGDMYRASWDGLDENIELITTVHTYENRVQAASSIYNYRDVPKKEQTQYGLIDYPSVRGYSCPSVLGAAVPGMAAAERTLALANAKLGAPKQLRMWILLYKNQPLTAAQKQEALWKRGNKNELILCIGVDASNVVQWGHCFSWTDVEQLKIEVRDLAAMSTGKALELPRVAQSMSELAAKEWKRKRFRDFDYLDVPTPGWAVIMCYVLTALATLGCSYWATQNQFDDESGISRLRRFP